MAIRTFTYAVILAVTASLASARDGHIHNHNNAIEPPPHGGTLRDAMPFKAEAVFSGDTVKIYIYDKKLNPITPEKNIMYAEVDMPKKKPLELYFKKKGEFYEGKIPGISKAYRYDLVVELDVKGKKVLADFGVDNIDQ